MSVLPDGVGEGPQGLGWDYHEEGAMYAAFHAQHAPKSSGLGWKALAAGALLAVGACVAFTLFSSAEPAKKEVKARTDSKGHVASGTQPSDEGG